MSRKAEKQILIRCDLTKNRDAIIYDAFQNRDKVKYQFYNDYLFAAILSLRSREEKPEVTKEELQSFMERLRDIVDQVLSEG